MNIESGASPAVTRCDVRAPDLEGLRQDVRAAGRAYGLSGYRADQLALAVSEVATNAIKYAGGCAEVTVSRSPQDGRVVVEVVDHGPGLPPMVTPRRPDIEATGGRGLYLVHLICDEVMISTGDSGTSVRLLMDPSGADE